jgi:hypothetical protein
MDYFVTEKRSLNPDALIQVKEAAEEGLYVCVYGDDVTDYQDVFTMSIEEVQDYNQNGGSWPYIEAKKLLNL